jgi:hypothetical protein
MKIDFRARPTLPTGKHLCNHIRYISIKDLLATGFASWRTRKRIPERRGGHRVWNKLEFGVRAWSSRTVNGARRAANASAESDADQDGFLSQEYPSTTDKSKGVNCGSGIGARRASRAIISQSVPYDAYKIVSIAVIKVCNSLLRIFVRLILGSVIGASTSFEDDIAKGMAESSKWYERSKRHIRLGRSTVEP